jgi:itaconyl-CoA hydratase
MSMSYDEFDPGMVLEHEQSRTVFAAEAAMFSALFHHHNPVYLDVERAREAGHPDLVVNPYYLFNLVLGLSVRDLTEDAGPFLGADRIEFLRPVYPGASVRARSTVLAKRLSSSRPGWGIVKWQTVGWSPGPAGEFLRYDRSNLVPAAARAGGDA